MAISTLHLGIFYMP